MEQFISKSGLYFVNLFRNFLKNRETAHLKNLLIWAGTILGMVPF